MNKNLLAYYSVVTLFFIAILFSVRYIVNTTRIAIDYESGINPVEISWDINAQDSILRVKEPIYITKEYYLIDSQKEKYKSDSMITAQLFQDSIPNKGSILNLKPPFVLWKSAMNDTVKVFKNEKTLKFVKLQ